MSHDERMTSPHVTLYGIPNCDTVKKARAWLNERKIPHAFHDFKKQGVPVDRLALWTETVSWEKLLNRQGTTWRKLPAELQATVHDAASALAVMAEHPSTIKRPVVEWTGVPQDHVTVGFRPEEWEQHLKALHAV